MNGGGDYYTTCSDGTQTINSLPGVLHRLRLPTRGILEWTYQTHSYPARGLFLPPNLPGFEVTSSLGVKTRKLLDAAGNCGSCTWTYAAGQTGQNPNQERWVRVTYPTGDETVFHFSVTADLSVSTWTGWEYGLPFKKSATHGAGYFLSQEIYEGSVASGAKRRSIYLGYEHDRLPSSAVRPQPWYHSNRRVVRRKTVYHDDGNREATVVHSQFDGLGHYRFSLLGGTFDAGNTRLESVFFNPAQGTYFVNPSTNQQSSGYTPWSTTSPWVLDTFTSRQVTEGGQTAREEFCFQANTGYLLRHRLIKTGVIHGANDLISVFTRNSQGNTIRERRYGSDLGSVGTGAVCSTSLGAEQFRMDHTYQHGSLATSRIYHANGTPMSFFSVDRTIDPNTGLPSSARDTAFVQTTFDYDALGRLTAETPAFDARTTYVYNRAQGTGLANLRIRRFQNGGSKVLTDEFLHFDHFGRPRIERRKQPSGSWSKRTTFYDGRGWVIRVSEWEPDGVPHTAFTRYQDRDPFGRPRRIRPPDGSAHDVLLNYSGDRLVQRTTKVATGVNGAETTSHTYETYDRQGRLHSVLEPSGSGGSNVLTTYGYDEAGRLASVSTGSQSRSFTYDNRGFLLSECHPEKGASGNGCVSYSLFNTSGQPGRRTDGPHDLRLFYDRAHRPTEIRERGGQQRTLKRWTYGTGLSAANRSNGKVELAERYNYVFVGSTPFTVLVREDYTYGGRSGRVSTRVTDSIINPQPGSPPTDRFTQSFVWNDLGDPASLGYPYRTGLPVGRTVSFDYTEATLTSVPGYASSISYHPNGMLDRIDHTNGITDVWGQDPNQMPRPAWIDAWYGLGTPSQSPRMLSGGYGYDGSGNVETIGNAYFRYDKVSRLVHAQLSTGPGGGGASVWQGYSFDTFGNLQQITTNGVTRNTPTSASTNRLTSGAYDAAGNLTSHNAAQYEYGPFNDMWHYKNGAQEAIYLYTADDERLLDFNLATNKNRWTLRDLDGKVLREYSYDRGNQTWTVERDYIYRDGTLLATHTPQGIRHFSVDHLGTPRLITNAFGNQVAYHVYYPFGEEATAFNQDAERMKFTGHERDLHSLAGAGDDLDYMHARFHSPVTGRFLSFDPVGGNPRVPQSWNRYAYVLGNPMTLVDPFGLTPCGSRGQYDCQGTFSETITVLAYDLSAFYRFLFGDPPGSSTESRADHIISDIRDFYQYRLEHNAASDFTTAAFLDHIALELLLPHSSSDLSAEILMTVVPFGKVGKLAKIVARNVHGGKTTVSAVLKGAEQWLGKGYKEIAPGVFRSADGRRQFRMRDVDLGTSQPHVHFESIGPDGRTILENSHAYLVS